MEERQGDVNDTHHIKLGMLNVCCVIVGTFQNPKASQDFEDSLKKLKLVYLIGLESWLQ